MEYRIIEYKNHLGKNVFKIEFKKTYNFLLFKKEVWKEVVVKIYDRERRDKGYFSKMSFRHYSIDQSRYVISLYKEVNRLKPFKHKGYKVFPCLYKNDGVNKSLQISWFCNYEEYFIHHPDPSFVLISLNNCLNVNKPINIYT